MGVQFTCPRCHQPNEHTEYGIYPLISEFPVYGCRQCGALWVLRTVQEVLSPSQSFLVDPTGRAQDQHNTSAHAPTSSPRFGERSDPVLGDLPVSETPPDLSRYRFEFYDASADPNEPLAWPPPPLDIPKRLREYGLGDPGDETPR